MTAYFVESLKIISLLANPPSQPVPEPIQHIGDMIREARKQAGLTQKELSVRLGVSVSAVTKMETRKTAHSVETLERVATAIGKKLQISFV